MKPFPCFRSGTRQIGVISFVFWVDLALGQHIEPVHHVLMPTPYSAAFGEGGFTLHESEFRVTVKGRRTPRLGRGVERFFENSVDTYLQDPSWCASI